MHYSYDDTHSPPAPIADVEITTRLHEQVGLSVDTVPVKRMRALLDTGAEISVVPRQLIAELEAELDAPLSYGFAYVQSANGVDYLSLCDLCVLPGEHDCFDDETRLRFIIRDDDEDDAHGILGRDFLNAYALVFDGKNGRWSPAERE